MAPNVKFWLRRWTIQTTTEIISVSELLTPWHLDCLLISASCNTLTYLLTYLAERCVDRLLAVGIVSTRYSAAVDRAKKGTEPNRKQNSQNYFDIGRIFPVVFVLAICVHYADINNSVLSMIGHVSAGFFRFDVLFLQGKHSGFRHIVASANSWQISMPLLAQLRYYYHQILNF